MVVKGLARRAWRRAAWVVWMLRYWVLWKYRRAAIAMAALAIPFLIGVAFAEHAMKPAKAPGEVSLAVFGIDDIGYYILVLVVASFVAQALAPKPKQAEPREANAPKVKDGAGIIRIYGTVWIDDPVVLAWQAVGTDPIKRKGGKK